MNLNGVCNFEDLAKLRAIRACVPTWSTCQRGLRANVLACHTACQCFNLVCRVKKHANFSTGRANVPKGVPIFQAFLLGNAK